MNIIDFLNSNDHPLSGKNARVTFVNEEPYIYRFVSEIGGNETINDFRIIDIEDGLYQLAYIHDGQMIADIVDLNRHIIKSTSLNDGALSVKKGEFRFVTETYEDDDIPFTNKEKAVDFWLRYFDRHDETAIDDYLEEPYIQHNPTVPDGVEAFRNEFHDRFFTDMKECHTEVKHVSSNDGIVFIHDFLQSSPTKKGHAGVDIFRFENGRIVEHWDVIQRMPDESKNDHPMF